MTTLVVERVHEHPGTFTGTRVKQVIPVARATDEEYTTFFVEQLREFLYRQGVNVAHIPNATLAFQVRNTFANKRAPGGRILGAEPVELP